MTVAIVALALLVLLLVTSGVCFWLTFYVPKRSAELTEADCLIPGKVYEPYHPRMRQWLAQVAALPYEEMTVQSDDGLTLRGRYYELTPDSPVEILFHGYRGRAERDLCGAVDRCFRVGHSALLVDQRAGGRSDGHVITFGMKEHKDALKWVEAATARFGAQRPLVLAGVSMGATTVLLAAGEDLPDNVVGVLADCGYSSARDIIKKVIRQIKLPANLLYPLVRLGAILYGGFDPNQVDVPAALAKAKVPIVFFHGAADDFVPCEMSRINYDACASQKRLTMIPDAGHCLCFPIDEEAYVEMVRDFDATYWRK